MKKLLLLIWLSAPLAPMAWGALVAADNAGNYSTWANGNNQGSGFGAWSFSNTSGNGGQNGEFLATTSGNSDLSIPTSGKGWGLYANSSQTAEAVRPFSGTALAIGQSFKISMDNGSVSGGGVVGFSLRNSSHANIFEFYFVGGGSNYKINNGTETDTGVGFTSSGLNLEFQVSGANTYSFAINGGTPLTGSFSGDISEVRLFDFNSGNNNNVYFNSLEITPVPEPVNVALGTFGVLLVAGGFWRNTRRGHPPSAIN